MVRKKYIYLAVIIIIVIIISAVIYITKKTEKYYNRTATIVERKNYKKVIAKIDSNEKEFEINSNIFNVNDKIQIKYSKNKIINIEAIVETPLEKSSLVNNIRNDATMTRYKDIINGTFNIYGEKISIIHFDMLPEKLSGQTYKTISPSEFFKIKYYLTDTAFLPAPEGEEITFTGSDDFKILSIENEINGIIKNISYDLKDKTFTFKSLGKGVYSIKIELKNGDIVNYIFI